MIYVFRTNLWKGQFLRPAEILKALTCIRSIESESVQALWMRYVCSMYSVILCKKLSGSLKTIGIVILDSSCKEKVFPDRNGLACGQWHHNVSFTISYFMLCLNGALLTKLLFGQSTVACAHHSNAFLQEAPYTKVISGEHGRWQSSSEHTDTHIKTLHSPTDINIFHILFPATEYYFTSFRLLTASPTLHFQMALCHSLSACSHRHRHL